MVSGRKGYMKMISNKKRKKANIKEWYAAYVVHVCNFKYISIPMNCL